VLFKLFLKLVPLIQEFEGLQIHVLILRWSSLIYSSAGSDSLAAPAALERRSNRRFEESHSALFSFTATECFRGFLSCLITGNSAQAAAAVLLEDKKKTAQLLQESQHDACKAFTLIALASKIQEIPLWYRLPFFHCCHELDACLLHCLLIIITFVEMIRYLFCNKIKFSLLIRRICNKYSVCHQKCVSLMHFKSNSPRHSSG
jgi:hypothetical protein